MIPVRYRLGTTWQMDIFLSIVYDLAKKALFINVCALWLYNAFAFW